MRSSKLHDAENTLQILKDGQLHLEDTIIYLQPYIEKTHSTIYREFKLKDKEPKQDNCHIMIKEYGSVDVLYDDSLGKGKVAILNFASSKNPGGAWRSGANAQEEALCRSSNLGIELEKHMEFYELNRKNLNNGLYKDGVIYSEDIIFFKSDDCLKTPKVGDVITCAAPNAGAALRKSVAKEDINKIMYKRIEQVLITAINHDVDILALGAFGCGVFRNPPEFVAEAMMNLLHTYNKYFDKVVFPLVSRFDKNYVIFKNVIQRRIKSL